MDKKDVIQFFDRMAPQWDADMIRNDNIIDKIFDGADIRSGVDVLDVACGTGVLFPDYLARKVGSITAVDISPKMVKIAAGKFPEENITVLCADVEDLAADKQFDRIMVYNAFPHFPDPEKLIATLSGMSRQQIDHRHEGAASKVSIGLMHEDALAEIFSRHLTVTVKISDQDMYQVTGRKNQGL